MHQRIEYHEKHPLLKRQPLKRVEVPISSIFDVGDPQLDHVLEVLQVEGTNEQTINYDASALQLVFELICELKHPETYAPLSHENDLEPLATRAVELIDKAIERITPFAAMELERSSIKMSSVQIYENHDNSHCPILRTMLQIALSLKMAKTICEYDASKMDSCCQYYAIRRLFRRLFQHSTVSKSMLFKQDALSNHVPYGVPFDGFIWHYHPAIRGAGAFILTRHYIAIRPEYPFTCVQKVFEKVLMPDDLQPVFISTGNDWSIQHTSYGTYYDERITTQGFRVSIRWHLMIVLGLFLSGVVFVVLINTLNRGWVDSVGVDPTSMLSLIIVIVGVLTTAMKAAFVENWNWFDFLRGRYYKTRIGHSEVVNLARTAIKSAVNQRHLFNKNGFSYVPGSSKEGPIVTDVSVNSAQLARHGAIVVWNSQYDPIFRDNDCIVYSFGKYGIFNLDSIGDDSSHEVNDSLDTVGVILSRRGNLLLR